MRICSVQDSLRLDLKMNGRDNQFMIRLMVGAPENSCIKQAGSEFPVNKY